MNKTVARLLGFVAGLVVGYCAVLFGWVLYTDIVAVSDMGGGKAMGIAFFFAPLGGLIAGFIGAVWLGTLAGRRAVN